MGFFFSSGGLFKLGFRIVFILVISTFIVVCVRGISQWSKNNRSPILMVGARVVSRRISVNHHQQAVAGDITGAHGYHISSSTSYYVTFEVESGDRMEFHVSGSEYGMLAEGDMGRLRFQGTRYLGFERQFS